MARNRRTSRPVDPGPRHELRHRRWLRVVGAEVATLLPVTVLATLGTLNLRAIGDVSLAQHQVFAVLVGFLLYALLRRTRQRWSHRIAVAAYAASVVLLLAVVAGGSSAYGAQRWLALGSVSLQPSELAKLGLLLVLADLLGSRLLTRRRLLGALALAAVPIVLTLAQPDLSTAVLLAGLALALLVLARAPLRFLVPLFVALVVLGPVGERFLRPYQLTRLQEFLSGSGNAGNPAWTQLQAHIALAWGGLFGQAGSPLHGLIATYLPARETDLAFASLIEEFGLAAGVLCCLGVAVLVWRLVVAGRHAATRSAGLGAAGLAALLGAEALVSVGGNLGLLPIAGVPFPFLSYGGTAAAAHLAAIGLVLGVQRDGLRIKLWLPPLGGLARPRLGRWGAAGATGLLMFAALFAWHLQWSSGADLRNAGEVQMTRCVNVQAARGLITDRHGAPLAEDTEADDVQVTPALLQGNGHAIAELAGALTMPVSTLQHELGAAANQLLLPVAGNVPAAVGARVAAAGLPGVQVTPSSRRVYPAGPTTAPLLGFVGTATPSDLQEWPGLPQTAILGRAGLEQEYDGSLRGTFGSECFYVTPAGTPVTVASRSTPVPGGDLRLSIDLGLQQASTSALASALAGIPGEPRGTDAAAVVMDARTGQVLSMASLPSYDDNVFGPPVDQAALAQATQQPGSPMLEHATQVAAPPGSTFKLVVGSADTVYGAIPPGDVIPTGYTYTLGNQTWHGWGPLPPQDLSQAIGWSNDVYFYKLANALGPDRIQQVATKLGVGEPSGIDLPGESAGYLGTPATVQRQGGQWYPGTTVILGIGQGAVTATPLQDARWTAGVATGEVVTPHLGLTLTSGSGSTTTLRWPQPQQLPFAGQLGPIVDGLQLATTVGTAATIGRLPMPVGGKTGTAEDPATPGGTDAWYTAVAPMPNPQVVVTVFVRGGGDGDVTGAQVAGTILGYYAAHQAGILGS
ncbi:MAG: FtsW/RodA/SpoVE family cell cycle protein [Candidatus Dormibacteraeota bacterium]|nr:FtsW/RodA/SpoVE family cell cycle protein [Candidatus Dormibacteraeota bacterium]MBO0760362.1 FtsW/RodA/SpoVE family cell cycle protein [Candidatus Dormibacteraeota bacterium]